MSNLEIYFSEFYWLLPAIAACFLASVMSGIVGSFVVARRMNNAAGGIAHIVLGGAGIAFFFGVPMLAASFMVALVGALLIGIISTRLSGHEDLAINALWSMSMAGGIILIAKSNTSGVDFSAYLFGNVLLASTEDIKIMLGVIALLFIVMILCWRVFLAISFDDEFAQSRGLPVTLLNYLMLTLVAITVVTLVRVVGIVFVVALLTVPVAITKMFADTLKRWMAWAVVLNLTASTLGLFFAYFADMPLGASIVVILGGFYWLALLILSLMKRH